jgi:S1-C subfamily serine protease
MAKDKLIKLIFQILIGMAGGVLSFLVLYNFITLGGKQTSLQKVVERNVYVEESALTGVAEKVSASLVAVVKTDQIDKFLKVAGRTKADCLLINAVDQCEITRQNAVVITSDGLIAIAGLGLSKGSDISSYMVIDNYLNKYQLEFAAELKDQNLLFARIIKKQEENNFEPIEFADLSVLKTGQKVVGVAFSGWKDQAIINENIITSISSADLNGIIKVGSSELPFGLQNRFGDEFTGAPIINLSGQLLGLNLNGKMVAVNRIESYLNKINKKQSLESLNWGLSFMIMNKDRMQKYAQTSENGALLVSGVVDGKFELQAVAKDSVAEKIGLKSGDLIMEVDGAVITENRPLDQVLFSKVKGDKINIKLLRSAKLMEIEGIL